MGIDSMIILIMFKLQYDFWWTMLYILCSSAKYHNLFMYDWFMLTENCLCSGVKLKHHILAVSLANEPEELLTANVAGFICVWVLTCLPLLCVWLVRHRCREGPHAALSPHTLGMCESVLPGDWCKNAHTNHKVRLAHTYPECVGKKLHTGPPTSCLGVLL